MLTKTNYSDWALLMKVKLRARLLWTAIEKGRRTPRRHAGARRALQRRAAGNEGESVEDYALRLNKVEETQVVEKIIRSVPQRFRQIVVAITMLLDVSTLTVADLTGRLKAAEDAFEEPPSAMHHDGKLYLTEEEWDARRRKRDDEKTGGGGSSSVTHRVRHGAGAGAGALAATRARHQAA
ncbi:unnamed protein product [Spirodela intermedia]|uniref:DUF4219 domain-containing protein n=1 Tax=Spirodela intermedia TaxID=51605 RepID=A0ABN7E9S1_SPIIN|nr:unnamed protein product [Spirodela intermedia]